MATPKRTNMTDYDQLRDEQKGALGSTMLEDVSKVASSSLEEFIRHMLDKAEDYLFTQAEFAENDSIQVLYNDAMREMHAIRDNIKADFVATVQHQIYHGLARTKLIDNFDERPAITTIVNRVRCECSDILSTLDNRFGMLLCDPGLETLHNPLGPEALCEALRIAIKRVETGIEIRLVVFKLFDQHVAIRLNEMYSKINQLMANARHQAAQKPSVNATARSAKPTVTNTTEPTRKKGLPEKLVLVKDNNHTNVLAECSEKIKQGKQRLDEAKLMSNEAIHPRIAKEVEVDFVRDFISSHWKNLLYVTCARHGKDSAEWNRAVNTMDDLIWSIKPKNSSEDRARLMKLQPRLLANLREGLESLSVAVTTRDEFLTRLIQVHGQMASPPKEITPPSIKIVSVIEAIIEDKKDIPEPHIEKMKKLTIGAWLNFSHDGGASTRAKLSWISPITGMYLFTDSSGQKYGSFTSDQMSELMRIGKARTLSATPMMSSAIRNAAKV